MTLIIDFITNIHANIGINSILFEQPPLHKYNMVEVGSVSKPWVWSFPNTGWFYYIYECFALSKHIIEALPAELGNRGNWTFISGEHGKKKGQILRGTEENIQFCGTGNIRKQILDFWGTGEQAKLF